jgi:hypothetical protein
MASMDTSEYLPGDKYLGTGVDTDFGGPVHYTSETADHFVLIQRGTTIQADVSPHRLVQAIELFCIEVDP